MVFRIFNPENGNRFQVVGFGYEFNPNQEGVILFGLNSNDLEKINETRDLIVINIAIRDAKLLGGRA